jgi:hypothetical protein
VFDSEDPHWAFETLLNCTSLSDANITSLLNIIARKGDEEVVTMTLALICVPDNSWKTLITRLASLTTFDDLFVRLGDLSVLPPMSQEHIARIVLDSEDPDMALHCLISMPTLAGVPRDELYSLIWRDGDVTHLAAMLYSCTILTRKEVIDILHVIHANEGAYGTVEEFAERKSCTGEDDIIVDIALQMKDWFMAMTSLESDFGLNLSHKGRTRLKTMLDLYLTEVLDTVKTEIYQDWAFILLRMFNRKLNSHQTESLVSTIIRSRDKQIAQQCLDSKISIPPQQRRALRNLCKS